jgi:imidazolonepropionase-like amidohydrolase
MTINPFKSFIFVVCLLIASCQPQPELVEGENLVVLEGATAITGDEILPDSAIIIDNEEIIRVGAAGEFRYPDQTIVVDLSGAWVTPGFIDTHVHYTEFDKDKLDIILRTLLANGVTTVRAAAGLTEFNVALRDEIERGERLGPRMKTAGLPIDTPDGPMDWMAQVSTPEEMRTEIRKQADEGVDYIKLYRTVGPVLAAVAVEEAHALDLKVIGHLNMTTWADASAMGFDGIVHSGIYAPTWELAPEEHWEAIRRAFNQGREPGEENGFKLLLDHVDLDSEKSQAWMEDLADRGTPLEPNLVMLEALLWGDDQTTFDLYEPAKAPENWKGTFRLAFPHPAVAARTPEWAQEIKKTYPLFEDLAVRLYRAGAVVSVGTDLMNPWMTPGASYHRELALLKNAGLTEREILKAATHFGAVAMTLEEQIGSIEAGKSADLVVLNADPLADVRNFRDIRFVYLRGRKLSPAQLLNNTLSAAE